MRTADFTHAPRIAQASAMFIAHDAYAGPLDLVRNLGRHRELLGRLRQAPGWCGHRTAWQPPAVLRVVGWFEQPEDLVAFARAGGHAGLAEWLTGVTGEVRVYVADESGYSNGVWRAEGNLMQHIETFTPIAGEQVGPPVRRVDRDQAGPAR